MELFRCDDKCVLYRCISETYPAETLLAGMWRFDEFDARVLPIERTTDLAQGGHSLFIANAVFWSLFHADLHRARCGRRGARRYPRHRGYGLARPSDGGFLGLTRRRPSATPSRSTPMSPGTGRINGLPQLCNWATPATTGYSVRRADFGQDPVNDGDVCCIEPWCRRERSNLQMNRLLRVSSLTALAVATVGSLMGPGQQHQLIHRLSLGHEWSFHRRFRGYSRQRPLGLV